jgi:hypothetical protein
MPIKDGMSTGYVCYKYPHSLHPKAMEIAGPYEALDIHS